MSPLNGGENGKKEDSKFITPQSGRRFTFSARYHDCELLKPHLSETAPKSETRSGRGFVKLKKKELCL